MHHFRAGLLPKIADEEIRDMCLRVSKAETEEEFGAAVATLKIALRDHVTAAENRAIQLVLEMQKTRAAS
jgi:hypothetical protein